MTLTTKGVKGFLVGSDTPSIKGNRATLLK